MNKIIIIVSVLLLVIFRISNILYADESLLSKYFQDKAYEAKEKKFMYIFLKKKECIFIINDGNELSVRKFAFEIVGNEIIATTGDFKFFNRKVKGSKAKIEINEDGNILLDGVVLNEIKDVKLED